MKYVKLNEKLNNIREGQAEYRDEIIHDEIETVIDKHKKAKYVDNLSVFKVNNHNIELSAGYFYNYTPLTYDIGEVLFTHGLETHNICDTTLECDRYFINKLSTKYGETRHIDYMKVICNEYIVENRNDTIFNISKDNAKIYCEQYIIRNNKIKHIEMYDKKAIYVKDIIIENNNSLEFCELIARHYREGSNIKYGFLPNEEHVGNKKITLTLKNNPKLENVWINSDADISDVYFGSVKDENEKVIVSMVLTLNPETILHLSTGDITVEEYKNNYKNKQNK